MIKSLKSMLAGILIVPLLALGVSAVAPVYQSVSAQGIQDGASSAKTDDQSDCLFGDGCAFTVITNTALFVIGAISVLMLIYGGIRYTISGGNDKDVVAAKNTIMYAIIGIVVALLAYSIVNFVLGQLVG
jgi:hypothetical protein